MEYFIQKSKSEELGPYDQGTLKDLAKRGDITPSTMVRNSLMKQWKKADSVTILKDIFKEQATQQEKSFTHQLKENITAKRENQELKNLNLTLENVAPATISFRTGAFIFDTLILGALAYGLYYVLTQFVDSSLASNRQFQLNFFVGSLIFAQVYWTLTVGLWAQTLGQKFFGLMQIRHKTLGEPVLLGRAYFFSTFFILFFPINFVFIFVFRRGLHELLSGSSVVNVRLG